MNAETLVITPAAVLHFNGPYDQSSTAQFHLENTSADKYLAFKVMTVEPLRYTVKPTSGTIPPGTSVEVEVVLKALSDTAAIVAFLASKQKFMIQWRALSPNVEPTETGIILLAKKEGNPVKARKLACTFDRLAEASVSCGDLRGSASKATVAMRFKSFTKLSGTGPVAPPISDGRASRCPLGCIRYPLLTLGILILALIGAYLYFGYLKFGSKLHSMFK